MKKLIHLEDALNIAMQYCPDDDGSCSKAGVDIREMLDELEALPSAQPEIIRCSACKHWNQTSGETKRFGLGECDFHEAKFVTCNGYCYWAERREDG